VEKIPLPKIIENLAFRVAKIDDIDTLCELLFELFSQEVEFTPNKEVQQKALKTIISDENIGDIYVATINEKVVAMVNILYTISTALGTKVAIFEDFIVDKNYRNQGIGENLIDFVFEDLNAKNFSRITLLTDNDNLKAHKFYEKKGFIKSSMVPFRKSF
jgi:AraC family transcriptional regulator of adaptative response/methylated-DNA-[protein]-cysteine methyltransferase